MPGTTPVYGFPYPEPTDLVADYPALGQDLAEDVETVLQTKADSPTWTAYTATLSQPGAITATSTSRYMQIGKLTIAQFYLAITGTGTGGNNMVLNLPATSRSGANWRIGTGSYYDVSANIAYGFDLFLSSTTTLTMVGDWSQAQGLGISPNIAAGNGDNIGGIIIYEAA